MLCLYKAYRDLIQSCLNAHLFFFKFFLYTAAAAKSLQSCPTLCDPTDGSPPGSPVPGILQARTLEWVAISFSNAWKGKVKVKSLSRVQLSATPWTAAYQAPPSMGFSRQEYRSGVPLLGIPQQIKMHFQGIRLGPWTYYSFLVSGNNHCSSLTRKALGRSYPLGKPYHNCLYLLYLYVKIACLVFKTLSWSIM